MSGVVKSVKKVFKKALPVIAIALAVVAVVFTGGAALGLAPTWGAAVSGAVSSMGATGVVGGVLSGAVTGAGYGAAVGGGLALATGGDVKKGATQGLLTGAVTGGVAGGLGFNTDPLSGLNKTAAAGTPAAGPGTVPGGGNAFGIDPPAAGPPSAAPPNAGVLPNGAQVAANTATQSAADGSVGLFSKGGWLERNQDLVGGAVKGLGQGLLASGEDDRERAARIDQEREERRRDIIRENYSNPTGRGLLSSANTAYLEGQPARPTPTQRFDPSTTGGEYVFDPKAGRVVFVAAQQA